MNWLDAYAYCEESNGYLAEVENVEMEAMLSSLLSLLSGGRCPRTWLGGNDI